MQLQCAAEHYHEEGQFLVTTFLVNTETELQYAHRIWQETLLF